MHLSAPFFIASSIGFFGRFIIALILIGVLYSKNRTDKHLKQGFIFLLALGGLVIVVKIITFFSLFILTGAGVLSDIFSNYYWYF